MEARGAEMDKEAMLEKIEIATLRFECSKCGARRILQYDPSTVEVMKDINKGAIMTISKVTGERKRVSCGACGKWTKLLWDGRTVM